MKEKNEKSQSEKYETTALPWAAKRTAPPPLRYNWNGPHKPGETLSKELKTTPGEAFTIEELYNRAMRGLNEAWQKPIYVAESSLDDVDWSKIKTLDLSERQTLLRSIQTRISDYQSELDQMVKEKIEADKAKEMASKASTDAKSADPPKMA